jgi:hypothetical protein
MDWVPACLEVASGYHFGPALANRARPHRQESGMRAILGGLAGMMLAAGTAAAATTVYYHAGRWEAFSGTDAENQVVCGIGSSGTDGRRLDLTFVIGGDALFFQAAKPSWSIPEGTEVPVVMQIGSAPPWNEQASGHASSLAWSMSRDETSAFRQQFRAAETMTLSFPSGNEPAWTVSLRGSTGADNTFARCIRDLTRRQQAQQPIAPTQPFGQTGAGGTSTQPFGQGSASTAPTQPFGQGTAPANGAPTQSTP